jgi:hypothetical protein
MCQAWLEMVSPQCDRCGGGYTAGLDNYIEHQPWCRDDKEVRRRKKAAEEERRLRYLDY